VSLLLAAARLHEAMGAGEAASALRRRAVLPPNAALAPQETLHAARTLLQHLAPTRAL
jgi:hypothetical protein